MASQTPLPCSSGLEVVDEATSPAPPLPFDSPVNASFNAAAGFVASSTREPLAHELSRWECKLPTINGEIVSAIESYPG